VKYDRPLGSNKQWQQRGVIYMLYNGVKVGDGHVSPPLTGQCHLLQQRLTGHQCQQCRTITAALQARVSFAVAVCLLLLLLLLLRFALLC
jgi:hypothetical protein